MEIKLRRQLADEVLDKMEETKSKNQDLNDIKDNTDQSEAYKVGTLTRETVEMFIKMVYVHDTDRLEIEYMFDDLVNDAFAFIESKEKQFNS